MKVTWMVLGVSLVAASTGCKSEADKGGGDEAQMIGTVSPPGTPGGMTATGGTSAVTPGTGTGGETMPQGGGDAPAPGVDAGNGAGTGGMPAGSGGMGTGGTNSGTSGNDDEPMFVGNFSFFVTSVEAIRELSGNQEGFGGDFGGLAGADSICQRTAMREGAGNKTWRAFLSATSDGAGGGAVHAINRIGEGPWYDRMGRLVAMNKAGLTSGTRPAGDSAIVNALPNERGEPLGQGGDDDHDILTGSNAMGMLDSTDPARTCNDWTSAEVLTPTGGGGGGFGGAGPMCGHAWPAISGQGWIQAHGAPGCTPGIRLVQTGPPPMGSTCVGCGGGYGGIYCFALEP